MTALDELITTLSNFTPDQLDRFLSDKITQSILQAEEEAESYPLAEPLCG